MKVQMKVFIIAAVLLGCMGLTGCQSADTQKTTAPTASAFESASKKVKMQEPAETPDTIEMQETEPVQETAAREISESFTVTYGKSQMEIPLSDCSLEYESEELKIYVKDIEYDEEFPFSGTVAHMRTADDSMQILGLQDYCIDQKNGGIYILFRDGENDSFVSMYRYFLSKNTDGTSIFGAKVISAYLVEDWLTDTYKLAADDRRETFTDLWLILTSMDYDEQGNVILKGEASGIYEADGEKYHIDWEINDTVWEEKVSSHEASS